MNDIRYVPPLLCLPPNRDVFPNGPTTYFYAYDREYSYYSTNLYGYYCYALVPIAAPTRRKKKIEPQICPPICIVGESNSIFSPPPLTVGCSGMTQALKGGSSAPPDPYSNQLIGQGGASPYTFSTNPLNLPPGITLSPTGLLSGVPTQAGLFTFTVQATDSNGCIGTQVFTINITTS